MKVNIVYKEILPQQLKEDRLRDRRKPFYDLFYPFMLQDSFALPRPTPTSAAFLSLLLSLVLLLLL